ncbi:acetolactate synthase, large subunit [Butyrivibrio fibrisolvens]|uniref:Acetolactate synthase n=1 Tax=Butyrivibrio fibrisolvens TaxID=831 RepID=A0A1H9UBT5_BUTFI|nr:biosynthetic-type acetolactate synthase large subunit [Butyrivibrio fibrisolvens]MCR4635997.1 biosynthetic-type acetolactate synthase large subunit [Butyrivibrio sp.]SES06925.1 acetolactate synthase, large subunit [Butyrivibrio fibrisolvens]
MIGADAIVECLKKENVEILFGYPGVAIAPFFNSLASSDIKSVLIRTEQNAAHCASGYARISGKPGVCVVTSGPGATNLITGIATAFADSIPLIAITGQVNSSMIGSDVFQEADITGAVESFVKYSYLVRNVNDIPKIFKEAFYIANSGRKGPVLIDIPIDIQQAQISKFAYPDTVNMRTYKPTVDGNMAQIKKLVKEVEKSKKPVMCVGGGVHLSDAAKQIREFADKCQIPVVSTMMGLGTITNDSPLYFGMVGNNGRAYANKALKDSDLVLMVGARVADRAVNRPELITDNTVLIHIDVDPAEIGKNVGPTIPLVGDLKHIFTKLNTIDINAGDHKEWIEFLTQYKEEHPDHRPEIAKEFVDPKEFLGKLAKAMEDDGVFVADVGQNQIWATAFFRIKEHQRFMTSGGMGTMGYAIPAALGAKLADSKRQVVASCGDGGFQMSMMELATMAQQDVPLKIIVYRNNYLGMVREYQHYSYKDKYAMVDIAGKPDLDMIAKAYGMDYQVIDGSSDIDKEIGLFLKNKHAVLLEVLTDPMDLAKG